MDLQYVFWLLMGALTSAFPILFIKYYDATKEFYWIIFTILCYIFLTYVYVHILKTKDFATQYILIKVLSILLVLMFSIFLYNNKLDTKTIIGILLGITSIYLLSTHA